MASARKRKTKPKPKPAKRTPRKPAKPAPIDTGALAMQAAANDVRKTSNQMAVDHAKRKIDKLTGGPELP